jgi:hypothetical protein
VLGPGINVVLRASYPSGVGGPGPEPRATHPVVRELALMLADDSPIPGPDRHALELVLDRMIDPYRKVVRRRRSA